VGIFISQLVKRASRLLSIQRSTAGSEYIADQRAVIIEWNELVASIRVSRKQTTHQELRNFIQALAVLRQLYAACGDQRTEWASKSIPQLQ